MRHYEPIGLRVESGDAGLLRRLDACSGEGRVHSVFTRVVNVLTPRGTLIALAARGAGHAPRTLAADLTDWAGRGLQAGQAAVFVPGSITLAVPDRPLRLTTGGARGWSAVAPSLTGLPPGACATAADLLDRCNAEHGVRGGMLGAAPGAGPMEAAIVRALHHGRAMLLDAIRVRDAGPMRHGVLALVGLGPGLTPAGDDFLTGLTLVAALPGSAQAALVPVVRDVLSAHPGRTTDLSLATLREACDARARAELLDVLGPVAHAAAPRELHAAARALLAIGHTSGSDTLSGLAAGLRLEEELRGPL